MTAYTDDASERARDAAEAGLADTFVERLAERIGARASVRAVFGEPIARADVTVVPVARVRWGVGGGAGHGTGEQGSGSGGGGGAAADPVGYLVIASDGATFHPIGSRYRLSPGLVLAAGFAAAMALRAYARVRSG